MRYGPIENGVVTNAALASADFAASQGWVALPDGVGIGWRYAGGQFLSPAASPATDATVNAERDRRLRAGMSFEGHVFQSDDESRDRIDRSRGSALAAIVAGVQEGDLRWHGQPIDFFWIAADDARVPMDAQTMVAFGNASAAREGLLIVAGNNLKKRIAAGEAIANIADDALWPA